MIPLWYIAYIFMRCDFLLKDVKWEPAIGKGCLPSKSIPSTKNNEEDLKQMMLYDY